MKSFLKIVSNAAFWQYLQNATEAAMTAAGCRNDAVANAGGIVKVIGELAVCALEGVADKG